MRFCKQRSKLKQTKNVTVCSFRFEIVPFIDFNGSKHCSYKTPVILYNYFLTSAEKSCFNGIVILGSPYFLYNNSSFPELFKYYIFNYSLIYQKMSGKNQLKQNSNFPFLLPSSLAFALHFLQQNTVLTTKNRILFRKIITLEIWS